MESSQLQHCPRTMLLLGSRPLLPQPFFAAAISGGRRLPKQPQIGPNYPRSHILFFTFFSFPLLPLFPSTHKKMIPRIRSTHLRNSQRSHHHSFHRQFTIPTPIQLELYAAQNNRRPSHPLLEEDSPQSNITDEMLPTHCAPSSAHSQPMPNGDLNGGKGGGGGYSPPMDGATTSSLMNNSSASQMAAAVALDLSQMEIQHFQLRLNVGGRSAQLSLAKIRQRADRSRLAQFVEKDHSQRLLECDAFLNGNEYYFERSAAVFEHILDYYISGKMHRPMDICPIRWRDELEYWRIPIQALSECCKVEAIARRSGAFSPTTPASPDNVYIEPSCPPAEFENVRMGKLRLIIWTFLENPRSSSAAKILSFVSALFVLLSLLCLILSSMPEFQLEQDRMTPVAGIQYLEGCCMLFFSIEYLLRFLVVPQKWEFVRQPLNIIDLLTIVPFLLEACLPLLGVYDVELRNFRGALIVIRVLRLARVARIFKLARYSIGLRAFGETMRRSAAELSMLGMFLLTGIMLFSTAIYFFERDEPNSKFYSIPSAWWWCVATMTTVGYGDLVPVTTGGKVVAAVASVCGIIVLAFPISMIIDKFAESTGHGQAVRLGSRASADEFAAAAAALPLNSRRASLQAGVFSRGLSRRHRTKSRRYLF